MQNLRKFKNKNIGNTLQNADTSQNRTMLTECAKTAIILKVEPRKLQHVSTVTELYMPRDCAKIAIYLCIIKIKDIQRKLLITLVKEWRKLMNDYHSE